MSLFGKVLKVGKSLKGKTGIIKGIVGGLDKEEEKEKAKKKIKKIIIIILIAILVIAILGQGDIEERVNKGILPSSEDDKEYSEHCPAAYYKSIYITEQGTLMAEKSVQEMWDEDKNATGRTKLGYSTYLSGPDALAYLLNAQIVTQYPYIDSASGTDLNGTVRFYRNESKQPMAYLSQEALQKYVDNYNDKGDTDSLAKALDSFSINNDGTITVAYLEEDYETLTTNDPDAASTAARDRDASSNSSGNGTYIVETSSSQLFTTTVAYQSLVRKYTMPFELLWAIAVCAHNGGPITEDFCYAMATMAYDGEIRLIIDDSNTVTTTTDNYKYDKEKKTEYSDIVLYRNGVGCARNKYTTDSEKVGNFWVTNVDVNTVNSPSLKIGLIQSWCALYNNDAVFTSEETQGTPEKNSSQPKKTDWEENGGVKNEWSYENCPIGGIKRMFSRYVSNSRQTTISGGTVNPGVTTTTESNSFKIVASGTNYKRYNNISQTTKVDTSTFSYTNGTVTSPAFNQDMADLINVDPYSAIRKFLIRKSERANFMRIIEGNEATANMVDLLNYIFEKAEDPNYDEEGEEWNSIWEALYGGMDGFDGTTSSSVLDIAYKYICKFEGGYQYYKNGKYQIFRTKGENHLAVGHGIDFDTSGERAVFQKAGYKVVEGEWVDGDFVEERAKAIMKGALDSIIKYSQQRGINLTGYQQAVLVSRYYNCGPGGWRNSKKNGTFEQAYKNYWDNEKNGKYFGKKDDSSIYNENFYKMYMNEPTTGGGIYYSALEDRRKSEWRAFTTGYFDNIDIQWSDSMENSSTGSTSDIVQNAIKVHKYLRENGYVYSMGIRTIPNHENKYVDCSTYVTWVLVESGVDGFKKGMKTWTSYAFEDNPKGWKVVSVKDAKAGDIVVYPGHIEIIADNPASSNKFTVYNCGGNFSIKSKGTSALPETSQASRTKNQAKIILRVTK